LKALAEARTNSLEHVIASTATGRLQLDDFNRLITRSKKLFTAWDGGTPEDGVSSAGATDIYLSVDRMEDIRAMAYNPQNTIAVPNTDESTSTPLPDSIREEIFRNAGATELYGKLLHEMLELGVGKRYNTVFDNLYSGATSFDTAAQELVLGVNQSKEYGLLKPVAQNADSGETFVTRVDDQWPARAEKIGWWGSQELGFICVDPRVLSGVIIK
jgi:hypothetical protein